MTVILSYEAEARAFYDYIHALTVCPYDPRKDEEYDLKPMIGSMSCEECKYHKGIDRKNKTVECSYEYEHLSEEEKRSVDENI